MKVGDLVRHKDAEEFAKLGYGIVLGFRPKDFQLEYDPTCDVWTEALVIWGSRGVRYTMRASLEVIAER